MSISLFKKRPFIKEILDMLELYGANISLERVMFTGITDEIKLTQNQQRALVAIFETNIIDLHAESLQ